MQDSPSLREKGALLLTSKVNAAEGCVTFGHLRSSQALFLINISTFPTSQMQDSLSLNADNRETLQLVDPKSECLRGVYDPLAFKMGHLGSIKPFFQ